MAYQERYPERMSTTVLAKKWGVTGATIRNMIASGQLECLPRKTPGSPYIITSDMACRAQGYDDFRKEYATSDPGAFITEGGDDKNKTPAKVNTGGEHTENSGSDDPFVAGAMKGAGLNTGKDE